MQVPVKVHVPVQVACVVVLLAADAVSYLLGQASLQMVLAEAFTQAVMGGIMPTLLLQHVEHSAALFAQRRHLQIAKKSC